MDLQIEWYCKTVALGVWSFPTSPTPNTHTAFSKENIESERETGWHIKFQWPDSLNQLPLSGQKNHMVWMMKLKAKSASPRSPRHYRCPEVRVKGGGVCV